MTKKNVIAQDPIGDGVGARKLKVRFSHWPVRGNVREDAEQCGQCVNCLTKISKCLKFVHDKIFELISRTIRELYANYAQTSRTSACQCVPMRVHRPSDTLFTTSSRLSYEYFAH